MYSFQQKYDALLRKDPSFEGTFIAGVKTTGIFCKPTCPARKPKPENVIFYRNCQEALAAGFRPCKVCKPVENSGQTPELIHQLLREINTNPFVRIKDCDLREKGIEPSYLRRWFKKNHQVTFHGYQRMLKINLAYNKIHSGEKVTAAAFESGFESLSGFNDRFQALFGDSPTNAKNKNVINLVRLTSPLGPMFAAATPAGVCLLEFTDRKMLETECKDLRRLLNAVILPGENPHLNLLQTQLLEYFAGLRQTFTVPLHTPGTDFQRAVWEALRQIPYGATSSYKRQALSLLRPDAVRAVAAANGGNRVAILVPCHRVIGENGNLKGYGGGLSRKKWLIDFEQSVRKQH